MITNNFLVSNTSILEPINPDLIHSQKNRSIGVVGAGPKGLYGLERLLANLKANPSSIQVDIHLYNRSPFFGSGDIYRTDQPHYLLMNYNNKFINMWSQELPKPVVPDPLSFVEWLSGKAKTRSLADPEAYAPRAVVGEYLSWGLQALIDHCPSNVQVHKHVGQVERIRTESAGYVIETKEKSIKQVFCDQVLMATGHRRPNIKTGQHQAHFIPFVFPVEEKLSDIPVKSRVAVKGLGLTFIDTVLALTEGRGGRFEQVSSAEFKYIPSGEEPEKIYAFSRSGSPIIPRRSAGMAGNPNRLFFNKTSIQNLQRDENGQVNFETQLLPLIEQEIFYDYYSRLFDRYETYLVPDSFESIRAQVDAFHRKRPWLTRFKVSDLLYPFQPQMANFHLKHIEYMQAIIKEAAAGYASSPFAAACATWQDLSKVFNEVYSFGGLTPLSQENFDRKYAGNFNRIAYGPPLQNMRKIAAVAAAGLLDFSYGQSPKVQALKPSAFTLSLSDRKQTTQVNYLIDARIPKNDLKNMESPLYESMLVDGIISVYTNGNREASYQPGCLALNRKGHPVGKTGAVRNSIIFSGTPTEGITFDNDTLSRERNDFVSLWAKNIIQPIRLKN